MLATAPAGWGGGGGGGAGGPAGAVPNAKAPATGQKADFNGDGYADLAVSGNGYVTVMYGTKSGLTASRHQVLAGPILAGGMYSPFGDSMAPGDLDGDGRNDLVAAMSTGVGQTETRLFRGPFTRDGANASTSVVNTGIAPNSLAAGDVDGDHIPDLLSVGRRGATADASLVLGSKKGFGPAKDFATKVNSGSIADVDGDGYGDVVLGAGLEDYQPKGVVGGSIVVQYGAKGGVSTTRKPVRISQDTAGVPGAGEKYDRFGYDLATGDVNGDGYADVAVGVMQESISGVSTTGAVDVLRGSAKGLTGTGSVSWHQNTAGVPGANEPYDMFGSQVALVDMNNDGRSELATGTDHENGTEGNLWYFKSGSKGLTTSGVVSIGPKTVGLVAKGRYFARWMTG